MLNSIVEGATKPISEGGLEIKDRTYHLKTYERSFIGSEFVKWLIQNKHANDEH